MIPFFQAVDAGSNLNDYAGSFVAQQMGQMGIITPPATNLLHLLAADAAVLDLDQDLADIESLDIYRCYLNGRMLLD